MINENKKVLKKKWIRNSQQTLTCSNSATVTPEKGMKYVQN